MRRMDRVIRIRFSRAWALGITGIVLAGIVCAAAVWLSADRDSSDREEVSEIAGIPVHTVWVPEGFEGRPGYKRQIKYVVIHETGNPSKGADAAAHSNFLQNGGEGTTSWHYTVDDYEIYHHLPDSEVAWHAGDKLKKDGGNLNGISIELCVNKDGDFEKTFDNGARLTAYLLNSYHLKLGDVKQHYDFNEKNCPQNIREQGRWNEFLQLVQKYQKQLKD